MGELIIANKVFNVDAPVVNWHTTGWDATAEMCVQTDRCAKKGNPVSAYGDNAKNRGARRYGFRPQLRRYGANPPLEAVKTILRQFVLHHDGMYSAESCFNVLHNERGLSCHFLVDNDGTIYQTLDLAFCGFHASEFNPFSIGVELCNRGDARKEPHYYDDKKRYPDRREQKAIKVHSSKILAYDFTKPQYQAMGALAKALVKLLPNLPIEYPQSAPGQQSWTILPNAWGYSGYIGHYHLTNRKWDPGPFDFKEFCEKLRGTLCFPLWTGKKDIVEPKDRPEIPEDIDELHARTDALIDANEQKADGGFFPVGPWGEQRLWHGGVHLAGKDKELVFSPFPGRLVAARMGLETTVGSANYVLLRHDMTIGAANARFFSLYMHVHDELKEAAPLPPWMGKDGWKNGMKKGETVLLDEPIEAGEVIARMGKAGPDAISKAQIHFEIFSNEILFEEFDGEKWQAVDGSGGGRFCDQAAINDLIDADKSGSLSRDELVDFYAGSGDRQGLRWLVTYHVSEWTSSPSWNDALRMQPDYTKDMSPEEIDALIDEQITPTLFWNDAVAVHARMQRDGMVYHYHPMTFIRWINEKILETSMDPALQNETVDANDTSEVVGMSGDFDGGGDTDGDMISEADLNGYAVDEDIALENLVEGFAGEPEEL